MDQAIAREMLIIIGICVVMTGLAYLTFRRLWGGGLVVSVLIGLSVIGNVACIVSFTVGRIGITWTSVTVGAFIIFSLNVIITVIMKRKIINSIQQISAVADAMAAGHTDLVIPPMARNELGDLAHSIQRLIEYHSELTDLALRMAEGDLSMDIRPRSADDRLSESFTWMLESQRALIERMNQNVLDVTRAGQQVLSASEHSNIATQQIRGTISQVARSTSLQTENIGQIRDLIEVQVSSVDTIAQGANQQEEAVTAAENVLSNQLGVAMREVSNSLKASHQAAYGAGAVAQQGAVAVGKTIDRIRAMATAMEQVSQRVVEMGHRSQQIVAIVQTIDEIAERTNLLALNAAIEAARAGEQGRGFAVVADEVRKLAERSAKSTKEIDGLIEAVQVTASQAVQAMQQSNREMEQGLATADETQSSLDQIQQAVAEVKSRMVDLGNAVEAITNGNQTLLAVMGRVSAIGEENSRSSSGLAAGSNELLQAIEELSAIAEENSAAAEQVAASTADVGSHDKLAASSAHELMTMANGLRELVGQFVLQPTRDDPAPLAVPDAAPEPRSAREWLPAGSLPATHPPVPANGHSSGFGLQRNGKR